MNFFKFLATPILCQVALLSPVKADDYVAGCTSMKGFEDQIIQRPVNMDCNKFRELELDVLKLQVEQNMNKLEELLQEIVSRDLQEKRQAIEKELRTPLDKPDDCSINSFKDVDNETVRRNKLESCKAFKQLIDVAEKQKEHQEKVERQEEKTKALEKKVDTLRSILKSLKNEV